MITMLLAYDKDGNVVATLDHVVARDADGNATGLVDFAAHEAAGGKLRDIWEVASAKGSATWPEWLGAGAHQFKVELDKKKRATALVHKTSGHRRERATIEAAIEATPVVDGAKDIRHLVGGPGKPLALDADGKTAPRVAGGTPAHLPLIGKTPDGTVTITDPADVYAAMELEQRRKDLLRPQGVVIVEGNIAELAEAKEST